jgi:hypothetical protein
MHALKLLSALMACVALFETVVAQDYQIIDERPIYRILVLRVEANGIRIPLREPTSEIDLDILDTSVRATLEQQPFTGVSFQMTLASDKPLLLESASASSNWLRVDLRTPLPAEIGREPSPVGFVFTTVKSIFCTVGSVVRLILTVCDPDSRNSIEVELDVLIQTTIEVPSLIVEESEVRLMVADGFYSFIEEQPSGRALELGLCGSLELEPRLTGLYTLVVRLAPSRPIWIDGVALRSPKGHAFNPISLIGSGEAADTRGFPLLVDQPSDLYLCYLPERIPYGPRPGDGVEMDLAVRCEDDKRGNTFLTISYTGIVATPTPKSE